MNISGPLTEQEKANAKEIFAALDQDGDGKITRDDLKQALVNAGFELTDDECEAVIAMADADGSGSVTWEEFLKVVEKRPIKRRIQAALKKLFDAFDTDGSGFITKEDLRKLINEAGFGEEVSDAELTELISKVDESGDGKVSFEEFINVFLE